MPVIRFTGQSARDQDAEAASTSRLVNCYIEPIEDGRQVLKSVLGTEPFASLPGVFMQALESVGSTMFSVCGGRLFRVSSDGLVNEVGPVASGSAVISSNNGKVTITAGGRYFVSDDNVITEPGGFDFVGNVGSVAFLNQHTVISERGGRRFAWSAVVDPATFDGLDFASAEARDDAILTIKAINGQLVIFKERSREVWYPTGSSVSTQIFARAAGGVHDTGLMSEALLVEMDQSILFVGDDGIVYLTDGHTQRPVSNRALETAIRMGQPRRCAYYEDEGHKFACITFADRPAWCFDVATGLWHERENGEGVWTVVETAKLGRDWYAATEGGEIVRFVRNNVDGTEPLRRSAVSRPIYNDGAMFRLAQIEAYPRTGRNDFSYIEEATIGDADGSLVDAENSLLLFSRELVEVPAYLSLALSRDNGQTWGEPKRRPLGVLGDYDIRVNWRGLGAYRSATMRLDWSTPSEVTVINEIRVVLA